MQDTVVLYTWMAMGHLTPMIEIAKLFVGHGLAVTIAVANTPKNAKSADTIARLSSSNPCLSFHILQPQHPSDTTIETNCSSDSNYHRSPFRDSHTEIQAINPTLQTLLRSLPSVLAIVIDCFCSYALDVARELNIPAYLFYPSAASDNAAFLHLPVLDSTMTVSFKDMGNALVHFPGVPPVPASHMPEPLLDRKTRAYEIILYHFERLPKGDGLIVNSFEWLEPRAVKALKEGTCLPGKCMPPV